jgi:hypothetical protein
MSTNDRGLPVPIRIYLSTDIVLMTINRLKQEAYAAYRKAYTTANAERQIIINPAIKDWMTR